MTKQCRSATMAAIHETAEDLHAIGLLDKQTMRHFDEACLTPVHRLSPDEIRALREREGASQAVFARYLNVTTGIVSQWERGEKHTQGASLKLLSLAAKYGLSAVASLVLKKPSCMTAMGFHERLSNRQRFPLSEFDDNLDFFFMLTDTLDYNLQTKEHSESNSS